MARIAVVEDDLGNRELLEHVLAIYGHRVDSFCDLQAGQAADPLLYELYVIDVILPDGSGLDLVRQLAGRLPILVVSAGAFAKDLAEAYQAGADEVLIKPFDLVDLVAAVDRLLRQRS